MSGRRAIAFPQRILFILFIYVYLWCTVTTTVSRKSRDNAKPPPPPGFPLSREWRMGVVRSLEYRKIHWKRYYTTSSAIMSWNDSRLRINRASPSRATTIAGRPFRL